ncbi:hypothetical protein BHM03_00040703, partial [Ensete ventricosum]
MISLETHKFATVVPWSLVYIFTRCQGDRCVVNRGEGLTAVDFSEGDAATAGAIGRSEGQREKRAVVDLLSFDSENELIAD